MFDYRQNDSFPNHHKPCSNVLLHQNTYGSKDISGSHLRRRKSKCYIYSFQLFFRYLRAGQPPFLKVIREWTILRLFSDVDRSTPFLTQVNNAMNDFSVMRFI